jgi:hypothetical protein
MCKIPRGSHLKQGDWHVIRHSSPEMRYVCDVCVVYVVVMRLGV